PQGRWKDRQKRRLTADELYEKLRYTDIHGLGIVYGRISGNIEVLDFETLEVWREYKERAKEVGLWPLLRRVLNGYCERTPRGGRHVIYRCPQIDGNTKLALDANKEVLIETRGEGGMAIVDPSSDDVHPNGKAWVLLRGGFDLIESITPEEKEDLWALARTFDMTPPKASDPIDRSAPPATGGRPGDAFNATATWSDVLEPHGWEDIYTQDGVTGWRRPGKNVGISATTNYSDSDLLYVFSTSTAFEAERGYSKFAANALLNHDGDFSATARQLAQDGFGNFDYHVGDAEWSKPVPGVQGNPTQSLQLVELALQYYRVGISTEGLVFAVPLDGAAVAIVLRGKSSFRSILADRYLSRFGKVATASALTDAFTVLEGRARTSQPEPVAIRVAWQDGATFVDLGDCSGRAVQLNATGWKIVDRSPVLFRRTELTAAGPQPEGGSDFVEGLSALLNIDAPSMPLLIAWLVASFLDIPVPIARLTGEQGTGKSTAARIMTMLVDPSPAPLRSPPRDIADWAVTASASRVCALDNLSYIANWFSDALCQAVTGGSVLRRALYTDDGLSVISFRRPVLLTSIDHGSVRGDLVDRLVTFHFHPIPDTARRDDAEIEQQFLNAWADLVGGLYDVAVKVLAELPSISLTHRPRMADYAAVLAAVDRILGTEGLEEYLQSREGLAAEVVAGDPVAEAIIAFLDKIEADDAALGAGNELIDHGWQGTSTSLLNHLTPERPPRRWPTSSQALSGRLQRLASDLRTVGIEVTSGRGGAGGKRFIRIERTPADAPDGTEE
ncbi:MAG TPA: hypothetical protein VIK61_09030, partial [Acidimicrobiia bacterium]